MTAKPLAISLGDPAGIGPEITVKAWQALRKTGPAFLVVGDAQMVAAASSAGTLPGDAGNALLLAGVADSPIAGLDGQDPGEAYGRLVGRVGQRKSQAASTLANREAMAAQIQTMRDSVSGVSLDEEMVAMTQYQRAFEAASRVFTTADQLLEDLINTLGR